MGQKPDDWMTVSLCGGLEGCHAKQHRQGEQTFWKGFAVADLIEAFIAASPKKAEIQRIRKERTSG